MNSIKKISVIIPYRLSFSRQYLLGRLRYLVNEFKLFKEIEFCFVDSGSTGEDSALLKEEIESSGHVYLYHESMGQTFSIAKVRNFGVQYATAPLITFFDADLAVDRSFFYDLLKLINYKKLSKMHSCFFVIPCVYLSAKGTDEFLSLSPDERLFFLVENTAYKKSPLVEMVAPCSSVMVVSKHIYLSLGGNSSLFKGHGYEDFEFIHRVVDYLDLYEQRAANYYRDSKTWENLSYNGFRSQFALLSGETCQLGLLVAHLWHPRSNELDYESIKSSNHDFALNLFKQYDSTSMPPLALEDKSFVGGKTVVFGSYDTRFYKCLMEAVPYLGELIFCKEGDFIEDTIFKEEDLLWFLKQNNVSRLVFHNPYGNEVRLHLYKWCRLNKVPFYCFERGALPGSWFFDQEGFNVDSSSYDSARWDVPLSEESREDALKYIDEVLCGNDYLEKQGDRLSDDLLRSVLGVHGKRILFVPLQRPQDTVIKFFAGKVFSYDNFLSQIEELGAALKSLGWVVVYKKHPLENDSPKLSHCIEAPVDANIIDLVGVCDAVALINSGVGVYAAMMNKPCYVFGEAFYSHPQINVSVGNFTEVLHDIKNCCLFKPAPDVVLRFVHYLRFKFYSYGRTQYVSDVDKYGKPISCAAGIKFSQLILGNKVMFAGLDLKVRKITTSGTAFTRYRYSWFQCSKKNINKAQKPSVKNKSFTDVYSAKSYETLKSLLNVDGSLDFMRAAYKFYLDRDPDKEGLKYYGDALESGIISRQSVCVYLALSPEGRRIKAPYRKGWVLSAVWQNIRARVCS